MNIIYFVTLMKLNSPSDVKAVYDVAKAAVDFEASNTGAVSITSRTALRTGAVT